MKKNVLLWSVLLTLFGLVSCNDEEYSVEANAPKSHSNLHQKSGVETLDTIKVEGNETSSAVDTGGETGQNPVKP